MLNYFIRAITISISSLVFNQYTLFIKSIFFGENLINTVIFCDLRGNYKLKDSHLKTLIYLREDRKNVYDGLMTT